ncbi:MAG: phosphate regulon sensor histidine kinase PhoR [SAR92 clade bacterium]|nr:phosphate regulon sensor histidine kinase PhoR [SAR92 clade bacterium]
MRREIWRVVLIGISSLIFGWTLGFFFEVILLSLTLYLLWAFQTFSLIFNWIDKGLRGIPPEVDGVWGEITDTLNRQRRRHRRAQDKMRVTINRMTRVTEVLDEGILVLHSNRTLDWWNDSAKRFLGLRTSDRGTSIMNLIRDPEFVEYINQENFSGPIKLMSAIQDDVLLELTATYFGQNEVVLVITDISRLSKLQRLRSEFVSNVSHELRTPLTVVRGYLETLQDMSNGTALEVKAYAQMSEQVTRMQTLADDLILLSQLEEVSGSADIEEFDLSVVVNSIVLEAEALSGKKHTFTFVPDAVTVSANQRDIRMALGNIIFNAVRHNPQGADIDIGLKPQQQGVMISIKDNGVGIDPAEIPRLTERFYRGDNSRNSQTGGSGLGLAIVKHAIIQAGGNLTIHSRLGQGAQFDCWLPYSQE